MHKTAGPAPDGPDSAVPAAAPGSALPRRRVAGGPVAPTVLGFGGAPIGNLYAPVDAAEAEAAVAAALASGVRYFDTAPYYGYGLGEARLGDALAGQVRAELVISTKAGRRIEDEATAQGRDGFAVAGRRAVFDYGRDGVLRAFEASLRRLRTDYVDILLLHDIGRLTHGDRHPEVLRQALEEALPAMAELKASGACRAIGLGVNEEDVCLEVLPRFPLDCVMLAGRYTLLEQARSARLMALAGERGVSILAAGPYNSGLLGDARRPGATYDYRPVDPDTLARAQRLYDLCAGEGAETGAAALQFPLAHPAVATVVAGMRNAEEARSAAARMHAEVPSTLWPRLRAAGLLAAEAPTPACT
ncbi:aldo/keto reductase [Luteimonas suaedae]|uniref:aldo/keto reductase n=1 Tax=Luteimonas suaedae TaxID=2605430 RepID=UPI0011EC6B4F|nr:aldo/keto reductase [Luteimonas suaedae]